MKKVVGCETPEEKDEPEDEGGEIEDKALRFDRRCWVGGSARRILNGNRSGGAGKDSVRRRDWSGEGEERAAMNSLAGLRG